MNLIIITILLGALIGLRRGFKRYWGRDVQEHGSSQKPMSTKNVRISMFFETVGGLLIGGVAGLVLSAILSIFVKHDRILSNGDRVEIHAMADGSSTTGSFFLGGGTIDNKQYYYYYEKLGNGGFKQKKVNVENVTIFEHDDMSDGYMIPQKKSLPNDHWAIGWAVFEGTGGCGCGGGYYEFHIPTGSIKHDYNLDLE